MWIRKATITTLTAVESMINSYVSVEFHKAGFQVRFDRYRENWCVSSGIAARSKKE